MLPEATHWFDLDGEKVCRSHYETNILGSETWVTDANDPSITLREVLSSAVAVLRKRLRVPLSRAPE